MSVKVLIRERADWILQVSYISLNLLMKTGLHSHAKAVSYSALPFVLFMVYLINTYLVDYPSVNEAFDFLIRFTHLNFLSESASQNTLQITHHIPSWLYIIAILLISRGLFKSIQTAFTVIFSDSGIHGFVERMLPPAMTFMFLIIIFSILGDYLANYIDYSFLGKSLLERELKQIIGLIPLVILALITWGIAFLLYYLLPGKMPVFSSVWLCSLLFTCSTLTLIALLGNAVKAELYSSLYGMLGEFVYVLVWIYLGSILFFFWAEVLYVSEKIDIFVLEKIFLQGESLNKFERLIENFIFNRSARVFRRYGQHLTAGTAIIPDENPDYVYFLYSGCIGFYVENQMTQTRFGELKGGEIFGEMAHLLRENHNISIIAESDCMLFMLTHAVFDEMMSRSTSFSARIPTRRISIVRRKTAKLRESLHKLSRNPAHCANDEE